MQLLNYSLCWTHTDVQIEHLNTRVLMPIPSEKVSEFPFTSCRTLCCLWVKTWGLSYQELLWIWASTHLTCCNPNVDFRGDHSVLLRLWVSVTSLFRTVLVTSVSKFSQSAVRNGTMGRSVWYFCRNPCSSSANKYEKMQFCWQKFVWMWCKLVLSLSTLSKRFNYIIFCKTS